MILFPVKTYAIVTNHFYVICELLKSVCVYVMPE